MHELHATRDHLNSMTDPRVALDHLASDFFGPQLVEQAVVVAPADVPPPFRDLLVHNEHMTTSLEKFHGAPVQLEVIEDRLEGDLYQRKILLSIAGTAHVVEVGAVRIHVHHTSPQVREEILRRERPLGEILIRHNVLRRIEPKWFYKFNGPSTIAAAFDRPLAGPLFGRVGIIHCDSEPAIELLEVVSNDRIKS